MQPTCEIEAYSPVKVVVVEDVSPATALVFSRRRLMKTLGRLTFPILSGPILPPLKRGLKTKREV